MRLLRQYGIALARCPVLSKSRSPFYHALTVGGVSSNEEATVRIEISRHSKVGSETGSGGSVVTYRVAESRRRREQCSPDFIGGWGTTNRCGFRDPGKMLVDDARSKAP
jgi:hypothetical protein